MSKNKIFTNPKNLAIATFVLAITMGLIIAFLPKFYRVSQFESIESETTSVPSSVTTSEPTLTSAPPPVATPKPSTHSSHVDDAVNNLEWGNIAFNTPQKIRLEEPKIIELVLSPTQSIEELQSSLESQGQIESAEIRISNRMVAHLSGTGFKIEALIEEEEEQLISSEQTQWKWEVTPTKSGSQNLHLTLFAIINVSGQEGKYRIKTFSETIEVEVSVGQHVSTFVSGNWEWLWASILVPTAPFLWKLYQKKRGKNLPV